MRCESCSAAVQRGWRFCEECGAVVQQRGPAAGEAGNNLGGPAGGVPPRVPPPQPATTTTRGGVRDAGHGPQPQPVPEAQANPYLPPGFTPPPPAERRPWLLHAIAAAGVLAILAVIAVIAVATMPEHYKRHVVLPSPADTLTTTARTTSPTPVTPTPRTPTPTPGTVQARVSGIADSAGVSSALSTYYTAINTGNYSTAYALLGPSLQANTPLSKFRDAEISSHIGDVSVLHASDLDSRTAQVDVDFTSRQAADKGPAYGVTCAKWQIRYVMYRDSSDTWTISKSQSRNGSSNAWTAC